jgi:hypothetical protein
MNLPETHCHLDHLPAIDQFFVTESQNSTYHWPSVDHDHDVAITSTDRQGRIKNHGIPIPTPDCTCSGVSVPGVRNTVPSRSISHPSSFVETKFAQDLIKNLGNIRARYLYNPPWFLYDWHQDISGHQSCINFLLTDTPGARTLYKFPTDCNLHYKVKTLEYNLYKPVLLNTRIDHCIINMTEQHRYVLTVLLLDTTYNTAKEFLSNYNLDSTGYL